MLCTLPLSSATASNLLARTHDASRSAAHVLYPPCATLSVPFAAASLAPLSAIRGPTPTWEAMFRTWATSTGVLICAAFCESWRVPVPSRRTARYGPRFLSVSAQSHVRMASSASHSNQRVLQQPQGAQYVLSTGSTHYKACQNCPTQQHRPPKGHRRSASTVSCALSSASSDLNCLRYSTRWQQALLLTTRTLSENTTRHHC